MYNFSKNNKKILSGFTLIELLLYIAISSLMLLMISFFLMMIIQSRIKNQTMSEVEQQGLQVMQIIKQTIRNAESIISPSQGETSTTLNLDVINVADDPTIFDSSGGVIRITEGVGSPISLTNSKVMVSNLSFRNLSRANTPGIIRIRFTLEYINSTDRNEYSFTKNFYGSASLRYPQ